LDQEYKYFVGIDWGTQNHRIVLLDGEGRAIEQYDAAHTGEGLRCLVDRLMCTTACPANMVAIAVETSWGALVETLLDHGFAVFSINPKQVDRFRDRFTMAGAKDDTRDAFVLACSLRTDRRSFRLVEVDSPEIIRLRELSRFEDELKAELRRTTNRLWQQLHRYYPQVLTLSPAADDLFIWDLLRQAPTPAIGAKLSLARIQRLLHSHRISRFTADEMMTVLRAPALSLASGAAEAASEHVLLLLPQITLLDQQLRDVSRRIKQILKSCANAGNPDVPVMLSIPGVGPGITATLLSEASRPLRERDYHSLRCFAGAAPVTKQSAKRRMVAMRQACSPRLRQAMHHWATRSIISDKRSRQHYDSLRASGHQHARALRGVSDRLLRMLISMLKQQTTFNPLRRQGACAA
jgi:transposase